MSYPHKPSHHFQIDPCTVIHGVSCLCCILLFYFCLFVNYPCFGEGAQDHFSYYRNYTHQKDVPVQDQLDEINIIFHTSQPSVQQTGFFLAQAKGYYKEEGLPKINIRWPQSGKIDGTVLLEIKKAHFYTLGMARAYIANCLGIPNAVIALICPKPEFAFMVRTDLAPRITEFKDLAKARIGVEIRMDEYPLLLFSHFKMPFEPVVVVSDGTTLFRKGAIDALFVSAHGAQFYKDYSRYRNHIILLDADRSAFQLPGESLICRKDFLLKYPEICQKFTRATFRGYLYASENREEALAILREVYKEEHILFDEFIVKKQLDIWFREMDLKPTVENNGNFSESDFNKLRSYVIETKVVDPKKGTSYQDFFYPILLSPTIERIKREKQSCRD